jgi:hypothetical protein
MTERSEAADLLFSALLFLAYSGVNLREREREGQEEDNREGHREGTKERRKEGAREK